MRNQSVTSCYMIFLKPPHHPRPPQHRRWQYRKRKQPQNVCLPQGRRSTLNAGRDIALQADNDIKLLAAQSTADQKSTNSSISGSVGISIFGKLFGTKKS